MNFLLKDTFIQLVSKYNSDPDLIDTLWTEIDRQYSNAERYYHNLDHLNNMLIQLNDLLSQMNNPDSILFALYYHDIIYKTSQFDNEAQSAKLAIERMKAIGLPALLIETCSSQIMATKSHEWTENGDANYFTDADLSILGSPQEQYQKYLEAIRKEYAIYSDLVYKTGRRKVINHFLEMPRIFKTDHFHHKFEKQARHNLQIELSVF